MLLTAGGLSIDFAPYRLSGRVYGALLNHRSAVEALGNAAAQPPYGAPPKAPVLYMKPVNTLSGQGRIVVPDDPGELEVGASLGLIIGRAACRLTENNALDHVAGFLLVNDLSVPHSSYYRPSIRFKARDGFCPLGKALPRSAVNDSDAIAIRVSVDGQLKQVSSTQELVRPVRRLLADVTEFMTLGPGDIVILGVASNAPLVRAGQKATIEADGFEQLSTTFIGERE